MTAAIVDQTQIKKVVEAAATFTPLRVTLIIWDKVDPSLIETLTLKYPQLRYA